jgi:hypothetical protein
VPEEGETGVLKSFAATALGMMRLGADVMVGVIPGEAGMEWRELANKLHAFERFTFAGPRLRGDAAEPGPLSRQVERAAALPDAYSGLWATEGLGYAYPRAAAAAVLAREPLAAGRAGGVGGQPACLPARAVVPLSTGSALAVAEGLLAELERGGGTDRDRVRGWLERCRDDLPPGFQALAVEALGLVARTLHPWRLARLDDLLAAADPVLPEYLWHGAGRGLYFAPMHLPPWSGGSRRAFGKARGEPPHDAGRRNAIGGLTWALTLVNVRSPEVVEGALAAGGEDLGAAEAAIANGAASALLVWREWAGADDVLARFLDYQPAAAGRAEPWRRRVVEPCRQALAGATRDLRRGEDLAALFRCEAPA